MTRPQRCWRPYYISGLTFSLNIDYYQNSISPSPKPRSESCQWLSIIYQLSYLAQLYKCKLSTHLLSTPLLALDIDFDWKLFDISLTWRKLTLMICRVLSESLANTWNQSFLLPLPPCSQSHTPKHILRRVLMFVTPHWQAVLLLGDFLVHEVRGYCTQERCQLLTHQMWL